MLIAIDFDGTCVTHDYPNIGKDIGSIPVLRKIVNNGHKLILYTMRDSETLKQSVNWFIENNIKLFAIQVNPEQYKWTTSRKCYAQLYIDDAGLGIPLKNDLNLSNRPFVDWVKVEELLKEKNII